MAASSPMRLMGVALRVAAMRADKISRTVSLALLSRMRMSRPIRAKSPGLTAFLMRFNRSLACLSSSVSTVRSNHAIVSHSEA